MALFRGNIQRHWVNELNQNGQSVSREMIEVLLLNIDLTESGSNKPLYLVTKRNDHKQKKTRQNTPWKIDCILTAEQIHSRFGVDRLPPSSRDKVLLSQLECVPIADILRKQGVDEMVDINWKNVKDKSTKRMKCSVQNCKCQQFQCGDRWNGICQNPKCGHSADHHGSGVTKEMASSVQKRKISVSVLKENVKTALLDRNTMKIPVVVNKDERSLIEWKLIVKVTVDNGEPDHSVGISLRFGSLKRRCGGNSRGWKIECIDYDAGRIYEQHRLISDFVKESQYRHSYGAVIPTVTTKLDIVSSQSGCNEHHRHSRWNSQSYHGVRSVTPNSMRSRPVYRK